MNQGLFLRFFLISLFSWAKIKKNYWKVTETLAPPRV